MRPLWKGAISFGLVYVPIKLYAATENKDIRFNYLHEKCKNPVQYQRYCPHCETEVTMADIVKGYEYEKGKYVVIKDEDFENLPGGTAKSVDILDFVDLTEIDPVYFEKAYYLAPGDGGQKVYHLLKTAMEQTGKVAIANVMIRSKPALAVLRVADNQTMMMSTMFYPDEVRQADNITELNYQVELHDNELKMAVNLINNLSSEFNPGKYSNEYRQALMDVIQSKIAGETIEVTPSPKTEKVVDLMSALKASIDQAKEERGTNKKPVKRKKTS
jgi:DNA end-binding protein Ku